MDVQNEVQSEAAFANAERRRFLGAVVATVTAAAMTGGAAALFLEDSAPPAAPVTGSVKPLSTAAVSKSGPDTGHLQARLLALQAENSSLQANLAAAQRQLASYTRISGDNSDSGEDWRRQYEEANAQANDLTNRLIIMQGLLALYVELDALDVATVVSGGTAAVGGVLGGLVANLPALVEGLQAGRQALDEFEENLPFVEQGRNWLEGQMTIVKTALDTAETALNGAVQAGGSFLQLTGRWFEDLLKWLPFGIGQKAQRIMSAFTDLLAEIPKTLEGLQANVAGPLDIWLEKEGNESRLSRRLIKPVRHEALDQADATAIRINSVNEIYEAQLLEPVSSLVNRERLIREQITQYRQTHAI